MINYNSGCIREKITQLQYFAKREIMKKVSIFLGTSATLLCIAFNCQAAELPKVTIGGYLDTQAGYVKQKLKLGKFKDPNNSTSIVGKVSNSGITNDTKITIDIEGRINNDLKYGGKIKLNADTSRDAQDNDDNVGDKTMIFLESTSMGLLEMGAYNSASGKMQISANSIAAKPGGIIGFQQKWFNSKNSDFSSYSSKFVKWPLLITNCDCISSANKLTYYTPKMAGLQFGVSYTPDIAIHGTIDKLKAIPTQEDQNFKRLIDFGVGYEDKFKDVEVQIAFTGQHGKSKSLMIQRNNLAAWELGAVVKLKGFSIAGSYSDWRKSATPIVKDPSKKYGAKYWTLGTGYKYDKLDTSLTYFRGKRANVYSSDVPLTTASHDASYNKNEYISLSSSYKATDGFVPYAEVTHFKARLYGAPVNNRGYVTLIGTKLSF